MTNNIVQADYEALSEINKRFAQSAQMTQQMQQTTKNTVDQLRDGGWIGRGSEAFFREMDEEVTPAVQRLIEALIEARRVTEQIWQLLHQAEEAAAQPIPGSVEEGIGGATAGGANAGGSTGADGGAGVGGGDAMPDYYIPKDWLPDDDWNGVMFGDGDLNDGGVPKDWLSDVERIFGETTGEGEADSSINAGSGDADVGGATGGGAAGGSPAGSGSDGDAPPAESATAESSAPHGPTVRQWGSGFGAGSVLGWSSEPGITPIPASAAGGSPGPALAYQPIGDLPPVDNVGSGATSSATLHPLNPRLTPLPTQPDPIQTGGPVKMVLGASPFVTMLGKRLWGVR